MLTAGASETVFAWSGIILIAGCVAVGYFRRRTPLKSRLLLIAVAAGPALALWAIVVTDALWR